MAAMVPSGLDTACRLAGSPTSNCPSLVNATYDGNAFPPKLVPSAEGIIVGLPPSITAAAELLVPRSIPIILAILFTFLRCLAYFHFGMSDYSWTEEITFLEDLTYLAFLALRGA
jgi:hypothetical protein